MNCEPFSLRYACASSSVTDISLMNLSGLMATKSRSTFLLIMKYAAFTSSSVTDTPSISFSLTLAVSRSSSTPSSKSAGFILLLARTSK